MHKMASCKCALRKGRCEAHEDNCRVHCPVCRPPETQRKRGRPPKASAMGGSPVSSTPERRESLTRAAAPASMIEDTSSDDEDQLSKVRVVPVGKKWDKSLTSLLHFLDAEWMRVKMPSRQLRSQKDAKEKLGPDARESMVRHVRYLVKIIAEGLCPEDSLRLAQEVTSTDRSEIFERICTDLFKLYEASKKASTDRRVLAAVLASSISQRRQATHLGRVSRCWG